MFDRLGNIRNLEIAIKRIKKVLDDLEPEFDFEIVGKLELATEQAKEALQLVIADDGECGDTRIMRFEAMKEGEK